MKLDLHKYATEWATEVGHKLDGITTEEIMQEVNANLPNGTVWNDENMCEVEVSVEQISLAEADTIRRVIEDYLSR